MAIPMPNDPNALMAQMMGFQQQNPQGIYINQLPQQALAPYTNAPPAVLPQMAQQPQAEAAKLIGDIVNQYGQNKNPSMDGKNLAAQILSMRFQPTADDEMSAYNQNTAAIAGPHTFKSTTPEAIAQDRAATTLLPYTLAQKFRANEGGATGELIDRLRAENPNLSFADALYNVQTGFRNGLQRDANGNIIVAPGYAGAQGDISNAKASGSARGKATGEAEGTIDKRSIQAPQIENLLQEAEKLLPSATAGGLATTGRDLMSYFGKSTKSSGADRQLSVIAGALTQTVPRMEGPQSDKDVALYKQAAGDLANTGLPISDRLASLKTIRDLNNKYAQQNGGAVAQDNLQEDANRPLTPEEMQEFQQLQAKHGTP